MRNSCLSPSILNVNCRKWNANFRQCNVNIAVLNSPSKIEGVPNGRGRMIKTKKLLSQLHHTPPSLRATSPNLRGGVEHLLSLGKHIFEFQTTPRPSYLRRGNKHHLL